MKKNRGKLNPTQFRGFNLGLLNPAEAAPRKLGVSGVSEMRGFEADYNRPANTYRPSGAGVSQMASKPAAGVIRPEAYSLYTKNVRAEKGQGLYGSRSNPRNLNMYR